MVGMRTLVVLLLISVVFPTAARGQDAGLSPGQVDELKKWVKNDLKYQKWYKTSGNKVRVKLRRRPAAPVWLSAECVDLIGGEGLLVTACDLFREIGEGEALTETRKAVQAQRAHKEALIKSNLPGIMFVSVPDQRGRRVIKHATHFGMSLRLNTFTLPGTTQKFVSHLNFTNARIMDGFSNFADRAGLSLMGLSFTVKK